MTVTDAARAAIWAAVDAHHARTSAHPRLPGEYLVLGCPATGDLVAVHLPTDREVAAIPATLPPEPAHG